MLKTIHLPTPPTPTPHPLLTPHLMHHRLHNPPLHLRPRLRPTPPLALPRIDPYIRAPHNLRIPLNHLRNVVHGYPAAASGRPLLARLPRAGQHAAEDFLELLAERGQGGDEDADGELGRGPDGEVDAVPGGVAGFLEDAEFDGFEDGADGCAVGVRWREEEGRGRETYTRPRQKTRRRPHWVREWSWTVER